MLHPEKCNFRSPKPVYYSVKGCAEQDPRQLVDRILNGDPNAFKQLVKDHERLVGQVVFRMVPGESDREDLCQDIFVKVYQNLDSFRFDSKLSTWITRIAYTTCLNHLEKKKTPLFEDCGPEGMTIDECEAENGSPEQWTGSRQTSVRVCEEIDRLPVIYGTILSLFHLQEMSYMEIGQILSLPEGTVKSYLFRARRMLKQQLQLRYNLEELCA